MWFRLPALGFGVGGLWLAVAIATYGLFGVNLGVQFSNVRGSPLLGTLACSAIAVLWIFVWFAQLRIYFDATRHDLILWTRGYFRSHERRISLARCREVQIRHVQSGFASRIWRVSLEFSDGRKEHVTDIPSGIECIESLAESLEAATKLPVKRYDCEA